jgi:hypothetical protein
LRWSDRKLKPLPPDPVRHQDRAQVLGFVDAPDQVSAEVAAVKAFNLDDEQRHRLLVQERG